MFRLIVPWMGLESKNGCLGPCWWMGRKISKGKRLIVRQKWGGVCSAELSLGDSLWASTGRADKNPATEKSASPIENVSLRTLRGREPRDVNATPRPLFLALLPLLGFRGLENLNA